MSAILVAEAGLRHLLRRPGMVPEETPIVKAPYAGDESAVVFRPWGAKDRGVLDVPHSSVVQIAVFASVTGGSSIAAADLADKITRALRGGGYTGTRGRVLSVRRVQPYDAPVDRPDGGVRQQIGGIYRFVVQEAVPSP